MRQHVIHPKFVHCTLLCICENLSIWEVVDNSAVHRRYLEVPRTVLVEVLGYHIGVRHIAVHHIHLREVVQVLTHHQEVEDNAVEGFALLEDSAVLNTVDLDSRRFRTGCVDAVRNCRGVGRLDTCPARKVVVAHLAHLAQGKRDNHQVFRVRRMVDSGHWEDLHAVDALAVVGLGVPVVVARVDFDSEELEVLRGCKSRADKDRRKRYILQQVRSGFLVDKTSEVRSQYILLTSYL